MPNEIDKEQRKAKHGQFFFAKFLINNYIRKSPIFILSNELEKDDDVVICLCTTKGPKSEYDIEVKLKEITYIRTNKIHTINRNQLLFRIEYKFTDDKYKEICISVKKALGLN